MGYMRHHAIVVTGGDWSLGAATIGEAHSRAITIFGSQLVSPLTEALVNGYQSFAVFPDGSKEGWETSTDHDHQREQFIAWLDKHRYEDGSASVAWVEVQYGDDDGRTKVIAHSDEKKRAKAAAHREEQ